MSSGEGLDESSSSWDTDQKGRPQNDDEVTTSLMGLFAPLPPPTTTTTTKEDAKMVDDTSNGRSSATTPLLLTKDAKQDETTNNGGPGSSAPAAPSLSSSLFEPPRSPRARKHHSSSSSFSTTGDENTPLLASSLFGNDTVTPKITQVSRKGHSATESFVPSYYSQPLPPIHEGDKKAQNETGDPKLPSMQESAAACRQVMQVVMEESAKPSTWIGSFMCLLYHNVFCLTMGSAITGPYRTVSMLGLFTKMAALGVMAGAPVYWWNLKGSSEICALYPTVDLFTAPFLASIAALVDEALHNDPQVPEEDDDLFLASFTFLACLAVFLAGGFMVFASVFSLANLGSYLPFPVLAGFFAAVGVLMWTLAFKIDTQMGVGQVLFSGDWSVIQHALVHHVPSLVLAALMKILGPLHPFYVIGLVMSSIALFYLVLFITGVSMEQATEDKWFWSQSDLVYENMNANIGFSQFAPPAPFGLFNSLWQGHVHWGAVYAGLEPTLALSFLYLIRCSIHSAALKKNLTTLRRTEKVVAGEDEDDENNSSISGRRPSLSQRSRSARGVGSHTRFFSEVIDLEQVLNFTGSADAGDETTMREVSPKPTTLSLKDIMLEYGHCQLVVGLVGCFAVVPSVAAAQTFYLVRVNSFLCSQQTDFFPFPNSTL